MLSVACFSFPDAALSEEKGALFLIIMLRILSFSKLCFIFSASSSLYPACILRLSSKEPSLTFLKVKANAFSKPNSLIKGSSIRANICSSSNVVLIARERRCKVYKPATFLSNSS